MTTAAVITLATSIVGFIIWLWKRKIENPETKDERGLRYEKELHNALGSANERDVNLLLDKRLSELSRHKSGQSSGEDESGKAIHTTK